VNTNAHLVTYPPMNQLSANGLTNIQSQWPFGSRYPFADQTIPCSKIVNFLTFCIKVQKLTLYSSARCQLHFLCAMRHFNKEISYNIYESCLLCWATLTNIRHRKHSMKWEMEPCFYQSLITGLQINIILVWNVDNF